MRLKQAVPAALGLRVLVQVSVGKVAKGFLQGQVGCWTRQKEVEVAGSGYTEWESRVGGGSIIVPLLDCRCILLGPTEALFMLIAALAKTREGPENVFGHKGKWLETSVQGGSRRVARAVLLWKGGEQRRRRRSFSVDSFRTGVSCVNVLCRGG
ncbi:hypothetical protein CMEL01_16057 [Colletotrichum melonis]|uniref:Uncharacterized protein n=1 Tax=Colletotrichum melonis TaxID=1209925 RepID=A0AAI9UJC1_9PEZI|nr:hypothetical protein CMEL01_16057 [Colletotrichum melonis]